MRKQTPEPAFGIIKSVRGFRQFLLRGLNKVRGEWAAPDKWPFDLKLSIGTTCAALENHRANSIPHDSYPVSDGLLERVDSDGLGNMP